MANVNVVMYVTCDIASWLFWYSLVVSL